MVDHCVCLDVAVEGRIHEIAVQSANNSRGNRCPDQSSALPIVSTGSPTCNAVAATPLDAGQRVAGIHLQHRDVKQWGRSDEAGRQCSTHP